MFADFHKETIGKQTDERGEYFKITLWSFIPVLSCTFPLQIFKYVIFPPNKGFLEGLAQGALVNKTGGGGGGGGGNQVGGSDGG